MFIKLLNSFKSQIVIVARRVHVHVLVLAYWYPISKRAISMPSILLLYSYSSILLHDNQLHVRVFATKYLRRHNIQVSKTG